MGIRPAAARRLALAAAAVAVALFALGTALSLAAPGISVDGQDLFSVTFVLVFSALGVLIASRHPGNAIGWIFCGIAVLSGLGRAARGSVQYWLGGGNVSTTVGELAAVYSESSWIGWVLVPATFVLLLFPDGKLPSRRWVPVAWCAGLGLGAQFVVSWIGPGPIADFPEVINPYGVETDWPLEEIAFLLSVVGVLGSALSLVVRFRHVAGLQRQQIKWLAYGALVASPVLLVGVFAYESIGEDLANVVIQLSVLVVPVAAGIGILRYRLYDIDVVINRTLVYGALTATLALAYFGGVLLLQLVVNTGAERPDVAVAGSTLLVAALFRPARVRIQTFVNRRFYRSRYDTARTLELFNARLREHVDLQALRVELCDVVRETVQPAHISLWLPRHEVQP